ncbi:MAG: ChbG/HpnK family deacetylase [Desulfatibacillaceae bacterium]|nr:ChbG/HpnK family deacetylase [Desulfatibacillaceae bacterium]
MLAILNGDDYGLCLGANRGVEKAFEEGLLRSVGIMAGGYAFEQAADYARAHPKLDIGIHLVLTDEASLLGANRLFAGLDAGSKLPPMEKVFLLAAAKKIPLSAVYREWDAQIRRVKDAGLSPTHLDSHQFVHLFPGLWQVCTELARQHSIAFVRSSIAEPLSFSAGFGRLVEYAALSVWQKAFIPGKARHLKNPVCAGFLHAGGRLTLERIKAILHSLTSRPVVEIMLHPALVDDKMKAQYSHWDYCWENDVTLACDPALEKVLAQYGRRAGSFGELL